MKESESAVFTCKGCGKVPSFQCREHFVKTIQELRAELAILWEAVPDCPWRLPDSRMDECLSDDAECARHTILDKLARLRSSDAEK